MREASKQERESGRPGKDSAARKRGPVSRCRQRFSPICRYAEFRAVDNKLCIGIDLLGLQRSSEDAYHLALPKRGEQQSLSEYRRISGLADTSLAHLHARLVVLDGGQARQVSAQGRFSK